jgi:hypothetical protein
MSDRPRHLSDSLDAWQRGTLDAASLSATWRAAAADWPGLPARYGQVLDHLLRPLESSGLFTEESCAYSPSDLAEQLKAWLQHAVEHTQASTPRG